VDDYDARGQDRPTIPSTPEWEQYQADLAHDFYTLAFSHPAVESIIWWTITDLEPWRGMPAGLLDVEGKAKPAYHALDQLINHQWNTQIEATTAEDGRTQFRGFYGSYTVTVQHEGETLTGEFDLRRGSPDVQNIVLRVTPDRG
jgi:hypothetical protein